ncbi:hypothetical protein HJB66_31330, partial [Rhizobium lentis]|uniref:hypothetical protein n=1 Tax=Rhizobium lentis TaxID=1138194 RepID=UPI001C83AC46|nr:hypothetical protein [Rhizobium lentis]
GQKILRVEGLLRLVEIERVRQRDAERDVQQEIDCQKNARARNAFGNPFQHRSPSQASKVPPSPVAARIAGVEELAAIAINSAIVRNLHFS